MAARGQNIAIINGQITEVFAKDVTTDAAPLNDEIEQKRHDLTYLIRRADERQARQPRNRHDRRRAKKLG